MNIDQVSRDLVSKHWGAVDFDKLIAAEMRKLQEETLDEAARECDGKALSADAAAADFDQSIDIILEHKDRARSARALAKRIRSLKKHPPTQPDAQTEQPMHMQNGLTLEQREWIRAEIACALESRPAAPTPKADEMLRAVVEAYSATSDTRETFDESMWESAEFKQCARVMNAAREYVNKAGKGGDERSGLNTQEKQVRSMTGKTSTLTVSSETSADTGAPFPAPSPDAVAGDGGFYRYQPCETMWRVLNPNGGFVVDLSTQVAAELVVMELNKLHTAYTARGGAGAWPPSEEWCERVLRAWSVVHKRPGDTSRDSLLAALREVGSPTAHVAPGNGDVYRVKTKRQYSALGLRIDEVMSDASERHVDSIYWGELLEEKRRFSPEAKTYAQGWRAACERIEAEAAHRAKLYDNGSDGERSFGQWMAANALAKFAYETIAACPTPPVDATSPEAKGEGTVRDLVRKIDELRERALRERSNTALLDFRAATFDAWPTIRAALTGGAL